MPQPIRLLIVDDERAVRTALELAMPERFEVRTAESAEAALALLRAQGADLLLVDKNLPGMSGIELLRQVNAELVPPPWSVLMTGFASVQSAIESLNLRVYGYIEKPFRDVFEIVRQLERLAKLKSACDRLAAAPARPQPGQTRAVVVVAPQGATSEALAAGLSDQGIPSLQVYTVADAARVAQREGTELFVVDAEMESGLLDAIHRLREVCPAGRFIVAHPRPSLRLITQLVDLGVVRGVLEKPLSRESVAQRVGGILSALRQEPTLPVEVT